MILDDFKLDGKVAIVTGAARGLGQAMAIGLAEAGADVALVDVLDMSESQKQIESRAKAVRLSMSHRCYHSRAVFWCRHIRRRRVRSWD